MTGQNCAITVGINRYNNLQTLQFAQQDAESVRDYLLEELGCQQVYHFTDDSPPIPQDFGPPLGSQPTFGTLRRFFRVRFEEPFLKAGDNLWFFFAGHGIRYEDRDYLMPIDGDPGDVASTAVPLHYVTERLQRCGADNVILLIDACRDSSGRRGGLGVGQERQPGVITFFSCSPQESSYEIEELKHGAFTHALLEGLKLQGEGNCATVERLYHYLSQTVPHLSQRYGKPPQTPYGRIEPPTKNSLILLPRQARLADVLALKNSAMAAELRRDSTLAKQFWIRVLAVSPADPEAIAGIERLVQVVVTPQVQASSSEAPSSDSRSTVKRSPQPQVKTGPTFEFEVVTVNAQGQISQRDKRHAEYRREDLGNGVTLDLVLIPAGEFMMGQTESEKAELIRLVGQDKYQKWYANELPQHRVTVAAFWLGKYPITQAQWKAVAALPKVDLDLKPDPANFKGDNRPVEQVSWNEATEFCKRLSNHTGREYRLPSEAEWEYACRAGTTTPFHFGPTISTDLANYAGVDWKNEGKTYSGSYGQGPKGEYRQQTTDVGCFPANAFGLYDMYGNVWEWCLDYWHDNYEGAPTDGSAWLSSGESNSRLLRGGSWNYYPGVCRSANRSRGARDGQYSNLGFRVVCASSWTLP
jgi:formylglycine-generating enzyme required for sulfatase activity/uncharacterized caspase-like protein